MTWKANETTAIAVRSQPRATEREIEVCAQCHARRGQIGEGYAPGKPFLDYYRPALLASPLYHADGQQGDEVYTWGSFLHEGWARCTTSTTSSDWIAPTSRAPRRLRPASTPSSTSSSRMQPSQGRAASRSSASVANSSPKGKFRRRSRSRSPQTKARMSASIFETNVSNDYKQGNNAFTGKIIKVMVEVK